MAVTPAIPANQIVAVNPSVLSAGGNALDLIGLLLTANFRPPIGTVMDFADELDVAAYFGATSQEAALASVYFLGFDNSNKKPGSMLVAQYALAATSAWLQGGKISGLPLASLQALTGTLSVVIDGVTKSGTVNLSAATSFTSAAEIIQNTLAIDGVQDGVVTASVGGTFTATTTSAVLTVSAVLTGTLQPGDVVSGTDGTNSLPGGCHVIAQLTGTPGLAGTYSISAAATPGNLGSTTVTSVSTTLDVTAVTSGKVSPGDHVTGISLTANTYVASQLSGTVGGIGLYTLTGAGQTHASGTVTAITPGVLYDGTSGAFWIFSGTTGTGSTIAFATGQVSASLLMTQATGAVLSQGSAADTEAGRMNAIIATTQDWASFMTTWEPSDASKEAFATWNNAQNNGYVYEMWDTNVVNTQSGAPSAPVAFVTNGDFSGIDMIYSNPSITVLPGEKAAFQMGATASLDFTETAGRATFAFRSQAGLLPDVTNGTIAANLGGLPQTASFGNGMNFYGDYTTRNQAFVWWQRGQISGPFRWKDSYVNQIWLNNQFQLALMVLLAAAKSIPYNPVGYSMVEAACLDVISQAINFGAVVPGVPLSAAQAAEVNQMAGTRIDNILSTRGWYLQVQPAIPQVRAARGSPPCTFWYMDGGSIQAIQLASILIQ